MTREVLNDLVVSHDSNCYITEPDTGSTVKHLVEQPSAWSSIISEIPLLPIGTNSVDSITSYDHIPGTDSSITNHLSSTISIRVVEPN
jgi:hypothetical protein